MPTLRLGRVRLKISCLNRGSVNTVGTTGIAG